MHWIPLVGSPCEGSDVGSSGPGEVGSGSCVGCCVGFDVVGLDVVGGVVGVVDVVGVTVGVALGRGVPRVGFVVGTRLVGGADCGLVVGGAGEVAVVAVPWTAGVTTLSLVGSTGRNQTNPATPADTITAAAMVSTTRSV